MDKRRLRGFLYRFVPLRLLAPWILLRKGGRAGLVHAHGWARSLRSQLPLDAGGRPIPWIPYVAVALLEERLRPELRVLELGAGHSTLFFMDRVREVVAVEHDSGWAARVRARAAANVTVMEAEEAVHRYLAALAALPGAFDLILVDGPHRNEAFAAALPRLTAAGVILLDDSHRPAYAPALAAAAAAGFRHLHLEGHKAASVNLYRTTLFYRDGNCLGI